MLILTATCVAAMSVNAVLFGSSSNRISAIVLSSLIAAAVMMPVERLGPMLFTHINTFRANTSEWKRNRKYYEKKKAADLRKLADSAQTKYSAGTKTPEKSASAPAAKSTASSKSAASLGVSRDRRARRGSDAQILPAKEAEVAVGLSEITGLEP